METRRHGNMEKWRHGDKETWRHGHGDIDMETSNRKLKPRQFSLIHYRLLIMQTEVWLVNREMGTGDLLTKTGSSLISYL